MLQWPPYISQHLSGQLLDTSLVLLKLFLQILNLHYQTIQKRYDSMDLVKYLLVWQDREHKINFQISEFLLIYLLKSAKIGFWKVFGKVYFLGRQRPYRKVKGSSIIVRACTFRICNCFLVSSTFNGLKNESLAGAVKLMAATVKVEHSIML